MNLEVLKNGSYGKYLIVTFSPFKAINSWISRTQFWRVFFFECWFYFRVCMAFLFVKLFFFTVVAIHLSLFIQTAHCITWKNVWRTEPDASCSTHNPYSVRSFKVNKCLLKPLSDDPTSNGWLEEWTKMLLFQWKKIQAISDFNVNEVSFCTSVSCYNCQKVLSNI